MFGRTNSMLGKTLLYSHYFGDGSDGDFTVAAGETVALECALDQGYIYKQVKNMTVEAGATLKPANRCNFMMFLVQGDLTINGTVSVDKCAPLANDAEAYALSIPQIMLCANITGGDGGDGGQASKSALAITPKVGGRGGVGHRLGGGLGGGGASNCNVTSYDGGDAEPRPPAGISMPYAGTTGQGLYGAGAGGTGSEQGETVTVTGGAAPAGSGGYIASYQGSANGLAGDGYGGGAVFFFVKGKVTIGESAIITANGGNGAASVGTSQYYSGAGGGGGGGIIVIAYNSTLENHGTLRANGGLSGKGYTTVAYDGSFTGGEDGGVGTVVVSTLLNLMRGAE